MKKAILIFSGFNQRAVIALLRTLEDHKIQYGIIASSPDDTIFLTKYGKNAVTRSHHDIQLADLISSIDEVKKIIQAESYIIAPSTEFLNRFLLENRNIFEKENCQVPIVSENLYKMISDKKSFGDFCRSNDIDIPDEYDDTDNIKLPCVAKPIRYQSEGGAVYSPILIHTPEDLINFKINYRKDDFYFQQFIQGESYYLLYFFYKDGTVDKFSQQNYVQQPNGKSIIAARTAELHQDSISSKYETLLRSVGYEGLIMIEVKKQGDKFYMIEANPRMWGPSQLFVDANVNLFESFLYDNDMLKQKPNFDYSNYDSGYFWYGGFVQSGKRYENVTYHNYNKTLFSDEISEWMNIDVYNRSDTAEIFKQEIQ